MGGDAVGFGEAGLYARDDVIEPEMIRVWVAGITFVAIWQGPVCVAFVNDVFVRQIIGWSVWNSLKTGLVLKPLEQALHERELDKQLTHDSESGSQYLSIRYRERVAKARIARSIGSSDASHDNAAP